jgi:quercetin dioxygenase-like cupin family protein
LYAEGISNVGDVTPVHHHPGPEAWYTTAGEMCVETPAGKMVGRAGETNIIPADTAVTILATGTEQRRSVWLVLHEFGTSMDGTNQLDAERLCKQ